MGGAAAAAAVAAARRREEEEEMTRYSDEELGQGWEFKFVRSSTGAFRKAEAMRSVLERESRAGWVLLEKFDDGRLRFKRPVSARERDSQLPAGADPYATRYGISEGVLTLLIVGSIFLGFAVIVTIAIASRH